jgi:hypothetical protein
LRGITPEEVTDALASAVTYRASPPSSKVVPFSLSTIKEGYGYIRGDGREKRIR